MISNQGWTEEAQPLGRGMHIAKEVDMLAAKIDLLLKKMDDHIDNNTSTHDSVLALDSHMTCEVCGNIGHLGSDCPKTREDACYTNNTNGYRPQGGNTSNSNNFLNQTSLKDLVFGWYKVNESLGMIATPNHYAFDHLDKEIHKLHK